MMEGVLLARYGLLIVVLLIALYTDISRRKIYNWLTFPAIGLGIGLVLGEVVLFNNTVALTGFFLGVGITVLVFGIPARLGWLGGGDFKLVLAVACLLAGRHIVETLFCISLVGAVMAFLMLIWKGSVAKGIGGVFRLLRKPRSASICDEGELTIPYGVAIALGTLLPLLLFFVAPR